LSTLVIACPICLQKIRAPGNVLGRQIKCPQCKNGFTAVDPGAVVVETPAVPRMPSDPEPAADPLGLDANDEFAAAPVRASGGSSFLDYLTFRRMITPVVITGLFYFGAAMIVLSGLVFAVTTLVGAFAVKGNAPMALLTILIDFVMTGISLVMWRVLCEVILVLFRILDQLRELSMRQP